MPPAIPTPALQNSVTFRPSAIIYQAPVAARACSLVDTDALRHMLCEVAPGLVTPNSQCNF
eukprot:4238489-Amphidinium_carterae.1